MGWTTGAPFPAQEVKGFFSSPRRPDWLWGPSSFLFNGYRELFPWDLSLIFIKCPGSESV